MQFTVATYNIQYCKMDDGKINLPFVANIIKAINADFVSLQEIDQNRSRSGRKDQPKLLAGAAGYPYWKYVKGAGSSEDGYWGNAVFSKLPITWSVSAKMPSSDQQRVYMGCDIPMEGKLIYFVTTHFGLVGDEKARQAFAVSQHVRAQPWTKNCIVAGDLNLQDTALEMQFMDCTFNRTCTGPNCPLSAESVTVDWICLRKGNPFKVLEHKAVQDGNKDHRPIVARLEL